MEFNDRRPKGDRYVVLTQHLSKDQSSVRSKKKGFDVWEDAHEHASSIKTGGTAGSDPYMMPQVSPEAVDKVKGYETAARVGSHAVILQHKQMSGRYRD